jgi:hypothetical protein
MSDARIRLKNPWIAGVLAFLLPGAGHFYQGRYFKAALYCICILGLFFTGMAVAGWQAVQPPPKNALKQNKGTALLKYGAQAGVGIPALFALVQRERYHSDSNVPITEISAPLTTPFQGVVSYQDDAGHHAGQVTGTLTLEPAPEQFGKKAMTGSFQGTMDGEEIQLQLTNRVQLSKPIEASKFQGLVAGVKTTRNGQITDLGHLNGEIRRPFWNWFEVPMDENEEQALHGELGKFHELAMVFTWVAGLLNVLAIWDAVEGPALEEDHEPESNADDTNES